MLFPEKTKYRLSLQKTILSALSLSRKKAIGRSKDLLTAFFVPKKQSIPLLPKKRKHPFYSFAKGAKPFLFFSKKKQKEIDAFAFLEEKRGCSRFFVPKKQKHPRKSEALLFPFYSSAKGAKHFISVCLFFFEKKTYGKQEKMDAFAFLKPKKRKHKEREIYGDNWRKRHVQRYSEKMLSFLGEG